MELGHTVSGRVTVRPALAILWAVLLLAGCHSERSGRAAYAESRNRESPGRGARLAPLTSASAQSAIGARSCHAMAYVPTLGGVVAFGGARACGVDVLTDATVWLWNGTLWKAVGAPFPGQREDVLVAFDSRRQALVLYGGRRAGTVHRDTWEYAARGWQRRAAPTDSGPGPLEHAAMAFDPRRGRSVVFGGGARDGRMFDATFEWDGTGWRRVAAAGPPARVGHSLAWSDADSAVLLYGGFSSAGSFRDLWTWDGTRWARIDSAGPATTEGPALVAADGTVWLVGAPVGVGDGATLGVWARRDARWVRLDRGSGPAVRVGQGVAYDPSRRRLVLFGGFFPATNRASAEVWEFAGSVWRLTPNDPVPR